MEITKEFGFEVAHSLGFHKGQCANLHGHSYKMFVTLKSKKLTNSMIIDFGDLKKVVNELIVDKYDHACVINEKSEFDFDRELISLLKKHNKKLVLTDFYPTAEEMSKRFYEVLATRFNGDIKVKEVVLYETKSSCAKYGEDDI